MYDPYALDRLRFEQESLRRRLATAPRRPTGRPKIVRGGTAELAAAPRFAFAGMLHRSTVNPACAGCC
jgi:hypothetical protein